MVQPPTFHPEAYEAAAGLTLNHIYELGYAYDTGVSSLGGSSHEVVLGVRLYNKRRILSPSNLW